MAEKLQDEVHLTRPDQPTHETENETGRHTATATIDALYGQIDSLGAGHPLRPVTLAREPGRGTDELAEHAASLQEIKPGDLYGKEPARHQCRRPQGVLRYLP